MAEPLDYFFQGANLGMRAGAARTQQEQFKTNLAERVRQFDLNREIALDELELRQDRFSLEQKKFQLDQKTQKINNKQDRLQLQKIERELQEDEDWSNYVSDFGERLMAMGPLDDLPRLNPAAPKRINDMLLESAIDWNTQQQRGMRGIMAKERLLSKEKQYNDDVAWAKLNAPELLDRLTLDPSRFDIDADALRQARINFVQQRQADEALDREIKIRTASGKTTKPAETRSEWMRRTYKDFIFEDESSMSRKYDPAAHREAADGLFGRTGKSPTPTPPNPSIPPMTPEEADALRRQYGTRSKQEAERIQQVQKSRMQP